MKWTAKNLISGSLAALTLTVAGITLKPSPAQAWFVFPSGIYANVNGKQFYLGDFVQRPNPQCPSTCSWAVRYNGNLSAHGNGRTPQWIIDMIKNWRR